MPKFALKQKKDQGLGNPMSVLLSVTMIGAVVLMGPLNASLYNAMNGFLGTLGSADNVNKVADISFASDEQYWDFYCSNGWTSDSTCDDIVSRVQSCVGSIASPYCSTYENYLQEFYKQ